MTTSGSGESYAVNDSAKVVCGNVPEDTTPRGVLGPVAEPAPDIEPACGAVERASVREHRRTAGGGA